MVCLLAFSQGQSGGGNGCSVLSGGFAHGSGLELPAGADRYADYGSVLERFLTVL